MLKYNSKNWSRWEKFNEENIREIPKTPGVYVIRLVGNKWKEIPRLLADDKDRRLLIGESTNLYKRIKDFYNSAFRVSVLTGNVIKRGSHCPGRRFFDFLKGNIAPEELEFRYWECEIKDMENVKRSVQKVEEELIYQYTQKFGEVPPLNNNSGICRIWKV